MSHSGLVGVYLSVHTPRYCTYDAAFAGTLAHQNFQAVRDGLVAQGRHVATLAPDVIVINSCHLIATFPTVVDGTPRHAGVLTAQEAPELIHGVAYDFPGDFELKLEFRAAVNADSGLFVRKPQLQVRDYLVAGPYKELKKYKPQEWNEIVVVVKDNVAHCTCNGEVLDDAMKVPATGGIGLEADRGQMEYRHLRLRALK